MFKIRVKVSSNYQKTEQYLEKLRRMNVNRLLDLFGQKGVLALAQATPQRTGQTANSWIYRCSVTSTGCGIEWINTNEQNGVPIALLIQYGHGTGTGGFVRGTDYINPAMAQIFADFAKELSEEVAKL